MLTYPNNLEGSITILGEHGTARIGGVAVNEIKHWEFAKPQPEDVRIFDASYKITSVYGSGHADYYENVISTLSGNSKAETDGRDGLKSLEILIALYLSSRDGKKVNLPLDH
jgi:UDP-N-acetyl-2-amino-2-deoxyglucuronate dehydrogenase